MSKQLLGILGLSMAARKLSFGDTLIKDIQSKRCKLVILASDASENTKKKINDKCSFYKIEIKLIESSDALSKAIGKPNVKAVGVLDEGFAKKIKEL